MRVGRRELIAGLLATTAGYAAARYVLTPGATHPDDTTSLPVPPAPVEAPAEVPHTVAAVAAPTGHVASRPAWFRDALAEMRDTEAPGVAIVLPATKEARDALRTEIEALLKDPTQDAKTHLVEAVYVVAEAAHVGAKPGETIVLLGADGKRVSGSTTKFTNAAFVKIVRPLLRADDRLAKRAKAARTSRGQSLLADLDSRDADNADDAVTALVAEFASAGPVVLEGLATLKDGAPRTRREWIVEQVFRLRRGGEMSGAGRPLPFGTKWVSPEEPVADSCPACGMMMRADRASDVLELLAKPVAPTK